MLSGNAFQYSKRTQPVKHNFIPAVTGKILPKSIYFSVLSRADSRDL